MSLPTWIKPAFKGILTTKARKTSPVKWLSDSVVDHLRMPWVPLAEFVRRISALELVSHAIAQARLGTQTFRNKGFKGLFAIRVSRPGETRNLDWRGLSLLGGLAGGFVRKLFRNLGLPGFFR
jgi:hypothetical protein